MTTKTIAQYEQIEKPAHLWNRGGKATFYRVTPVKGARIDGTFAVGMTSHEANVGYRESGLPRNVHAPAMWVDLSPSLEDSTGGVASEREPLTINGKVYDARFGARAELVPAAPNDYREQYYRRVTVGGMDYLVTSRFDAWDGFSDSARRILHSVVEAIAAEYITDERWHAQKVSEADYKVSRATEKRDEAQKVLDEAIATLETIKAER